MGSKRAVLVGVVGFGGLMLLAAGMLSLLLSHPMASGRSGWDAAFGREVVQPPLEETPEQIRKRSMPKLTITGPTNPRGCSNFLPGETVRFAVTANSEDPAQPGGTELSVVVVVDGNNSAMYFTSPWPSGPQNFDITAPSHNFSVRFSAPATYLGNGEYTYEDHDYTVPVDTTTKPSFGTPTVTVTNCTPVTYQASVGVTRGDSWSYRLLDIDNNVVSGGTPNSPDTSGCSFTATVSGITGADQIEFTATNPNGTTTETFSLAALSEAHASISAEPVSVVEGNSTTLTWSWDHAASASIDHGVGAVDPSGSVDVSPTETTTYTITAIGECLDATASVTVYVEDTPVQSVPTIHNLTPNPRSGKAWCLKP
jgi:hypothetical protein